jgi:hypothetical protein
MAGDDQRKLGWRERRKAAKRERAERTGDSPEKRAANERKSSDPDVKGAASGAAIGGSVSAPTGIGGGF